MGGVAREVFHEKVKHKLILEDEKGLQLMKMKGKEPSLIQQIECLSMLVIILGSWAKSFNKPGKIFALMELIVQLETDKT